MPASVFESPRRPLSPGDLEGLLRRRRVIGLAAPTRYMLGFGIAMLLILLMSWVFVRATPSFAISCGCSAPMSSITEPS